MTDESTQTFEREKKESVKLSKMSKGYQWEILVVPISGNLLQDEDMKRLEIRNKILEREYGSKQ